MTTSYIPQIDISPLYSANANNWQEVARQIDAACQNSGFFYVTGHPISSQRIQQLQQLSQTFFAQPEAEKLRIDITRTRHHRGYGSFWYRTAGPATPGRLQRNL